MGFGQGPQTAELRALGTNYFSILLYGKITRLPRPEFCPHFARRRTHLHSRKRRFLPILGWTQNRKLYDRHSQIVSGITFFSRSREKFKKTQYPNTNGPKRDQFFATKFYHHFSGNPPNVTGNSIFPTQKTFQKVMKITRFELLR